jgi:1-acyl-sn-glycerol-3-phosphate acyltransferase
MSKKDKHKKAKAKPAGWIADLRQGTPWSAETPPTPAMVAALKNVNARSLVTPDPRPDVIADAKAIATTAAIAFVAAEPAPPGDDADPTDEIELEIESAVAPPAPEPVPEPMLLPLPPRVPEAAFGDADAYAPSYDFSEDTQFDIAPIGPTEYAFPDAASLPPEGEAPRPAEVPAPPASVEHLEQQIKDLEARLDEMIERKKASPSNVPPQPIPPATPSTPRALEPTERPDTSPGVTAKEVLSSDFYRSQWGRHSLRDRSEEVDEFGHDPAYEAKFLPLFDFLFKTYFRVEVEGTANIPDAGRCLLVANHSGGPLPYDGVMLRTVLRREHAKKRELRWLAEDFIYYLPFVGSAMNRLGAVRACQENAERLLAGERLVAVFPEGAKGVGKLYKDRYRLQRFGRGGFIRLCLRTQTPIVPCAIVGAEEANPMLYRIEYMAKTLGIPYLPITPTFPALGPLGLLPAPTKWRVVFGEPIDFDGYGPEAADDDILVGRLAERVRTTIQGMLDGMVKARKSVWFG